jgi:hypothetical protein
LVAGLIDVVRASDLAGRKSQRCHGSGLRWGMGCYWGRAGGASPGIGRGQGTGRAPTRPQRVRSPRSGKLISHAPSAPPPPVLREAPMSRRPLPNNGFVAKLQVCGAKLHAARATLVSRRRGR